MQLPKWLFFPDTKTNSPTLVNNAKGSLTIGLCPYLKAVVTLNSMGASQGYQFETASMISFESHQPSEGPRLSNKKALDWLCLSVPNSVVSEPSQGRSISSLCQSWAISGLFVSEHH